MTIQEVAGRQQVTIFFHFSFLHVHPTTLPSITIYMCHVYNSSTRCALVFGSAQAFGILAYTAATYATIQITLDEKNRTNKTCRFLR